MRNLCFICTLLVTLGATAISAFSVPAARAALRLSLGGAASCPAEKRLGAVPPRARSQAARLAMNWADPDWSWGYGVGKAHDSASVLRSALSSEESRTKWIQALLVDEKLEWEVVKLCLALQWQRAAREGRDGGTGGFGDILERLVDCKYEGSDDKDDLLCMDMFSRVLLFSDGKSVLKSGLPGREGVRRTIAAKVLEHLQFVQLGL